VPERIKVGTIVAGAIGNLLEWYDFGVYGYFAIVLGRVFFPTTNATTSLLSSLAVFGVGFFMRPVGAIVFSHYGDRIGRKQVLSVTIIGMGIATFIVGLLPSYATIGLAAPVLLVVFRLAQGFFAGGELFGAASFVVEHAPSDKRGQTGSWVQVTLAGGLLAGALLAALLNNVLTSAQLTSWGWRVPFLLGIIVAIVGLLIRLRAEESPKFTEVERAGQIAKTPFLEAWRHYRRIVLLVLGYTLAGSTSYYVFTTTLPAFAKVVLKVPFGTSVWASAVALVCFMVFIYLAGTISDRVGRRPLLMAYAVGIIVLIFPGFYLMQAVPSFTTVLFVQIVFLAIQACFAGACMAGYVELLPTRVRYSGIAVPYNIITAIFGGSAPYVITWISTTTKEPLLGPVYLIPLAIVSLICFILIPETARKPLA
jgi:MHS family proline/betaine transporter-like MFS transporter